jgi:hypothetical protein
MELIKVYDIKKHVGELDVDGKKYVADGHSEKLAFIKGPNGALVWNEEGVGQVFVKGDKIPRKARVDLYEVFTAQDGKQGTSMFPGQLLDIPLKDIPAMAVISVVFRTRTGLQASRSRSVLRCGTSVARSGGHRTRTTRLSARGKETGLEFSDCATFKTRCGCWKKWDDERGKK